MATEKQINANRQNARKSTGPQSPEGRAAVRGNALRHGLTAKSIVLSTEKETDFNEIRQAFEAQYQTLGPMETLLVQELVIMTWRLRRLRNIETGFFNLRLMDTAEDLEQEYDNLEDRSRLAYIFYKDSNRPNTLQNLARFEGRLQRGFYKALRELERLRASRESAPTPDSGPLPPAPALPVDVPASDRPTVGCN